MCDKVSTVPTFISHTHNTWCSSANVCARHACAGARNAGEGIEAPLLPADGLGAGAGARELDSARVPSLSQTMREEADGQRQRSLEAAGGAGAGSLTEAQAKEMERIRQLQDHERSLGEHTQVLRTQNAALVALFLVSAVLQVYSGVKCLGFSFTNVALHGPLMGTAVLYINILAWALRELVSARSSVALALSAKVADLHPHTLRFTAACSNHYCDVCGLKLEDGKGYRCKLCDFDVCVRCFTRKDSAREGMLRGDKGVRKEESLSTMGYFRRAVALAGREWALLTLALVTLVLNSSTRLFTPHIQGTILDQVAHADTEGFKHSIMLYIGASVLGGALQGLLQLSFNIIGRRLAYQVPKP
jgi:hypothetical protein